MWQSVELFGGEWLYRGCLSIKKSQTFLLFGVSFFSVPIYIFRPFLLLTVLFSSGLGFMGGFCSGFTC